MTAMFNKLREYFGRVMPFGALSAVPGKGPNKRQHLHSNEWPEGYFDQVFGRWEGSPLHREPLGEDDVRDRTMNRVTALQILKKEKAYLAREFDVTDLALFGSVVRDGARQGSDVDILVTFNGPADSRRYFGVQFYLEDLLGCPVDLVTAKALRPELRPHIESEAVHV